MQYVAARKNPHGWDSLPSMWPKYGSNSANAAFADLATLHQEDSSSALWVVQHSSLPSAGNTVVHKVCCLEPSRCSSACKYWVLREKLQNKHKISKYNYIYFFISTISMEKVN